ncbi:hypothetical protein DPEC_G00288640 [Dallia pectoralis]|uniref:Uncharacterized protein n=1 Tax=Dallia pectoralis TaxID=75939 RepID=A0ACC2FKG6_DALPE|nr:hypothetical protein DPEC_G00288640 [Dallia pectoralis]
MDGTAVEVLGVPGNLLSPDRMIDKLTIHFLRPRNGGGEVLEVAFPTSSSRRAVVVFEMPEVAASVLQHIQVLEVEGQHFPLQVWRTDRPEFDMPVKATLDVTMFSSDDVWRLLKSHGFQVTGRGPGLLLVHGSFLKLRDVKAQLQQLLTRETHHSRHTPKFSALQLRVSS